MKKLLILLLLFRFSPLFPQSADLDYDRFRIEGVRNMLCGVALSPDQQTLAIGSTQSFPLFIYDWKNRKKLREFNVGNWYAGSSVNFSVNGKYILLNQLYYIDFAPNKDREVNFEVVDANTGKAVKRFENFHDVKITPNEKYVITLTGETVAFFNLETGKYERSFTVPQATNSVAISHDGKRIAVSHRLYEKDAEGYSNLKRDKKTKKSALKYKQEISIYDAASLKELYTIHELYDIIYKLRFSDDDNFLLVQHIPHVKLQNNAIKRQIFVNAVDMQTGKPVRRGFVSISQYEPDFKLSHNGKLFGLISSNDRYLELHIYDFATGRMLHRFQQAYRLFEKSDGLLVTPDSRTSFVFLPGDKSVIMTMGNILVQWNFDHQQPK